jgi:hypothetical protein
MGEHRQRTTKDVLHECETVGETELWRGWWQPGGPVGSGITVVTGRRAVFLGTAESGRLCDHDSK